MIPNNIFQIALGESYINSLPLEKIKKNILDLNPGYNYDLFTDISGDKFLSDFYPQYRDLFHATTRYQFKSDLLRCLLIHRFGGYYIDIDLLPIVGFETFTQHIDSFFTIGAHHDGKAELANGFLGSIAGNDFFIESANEMGNDLNPFDYGANIKKMFNILTRTVGVEEYKNFNGTYFLRERKTDSDVYVITNNNDVVCVSNGSGYPFNDVNLTSII